MECLNCGAPAVTSGPVPLCQRCKDLSRPRGVNFQSAQPAGPQKPLEGMPSGTVSAEMKSS